MLFVSVLGMLCDVNVVDVLVVAAVAVVVVVAFCRCCSLIFC